MDKTTNKTINEFILKTPNLITAYLFGSFAGDQERPESDIDIALIIDGLRDDERFDLQVDLMLIAEQYDSRIEPHPLSGNEFFSGNPFISEIKRTGIEIKLQNPALQ